MMTLSMLLAESVFLELIIGLVSNELFIGFPQLETVLGK